MASHREIVTEAFEASANGTGYVASIFAEDMTWEIVRSGEMQVHEQLGAWWRAGPDAGSGAGGLGRCTRCPAQPRGGRNVRSQPRARSPHTSHRSDHAVRGGQTAAYQATIVAPSRAGRELSTIRIAAWIRGARAV